MSQQAADESPRELALKLKLAVLRAGVGWCSGGRAFDQDHQWYHVLAENCGVLPVAISYLLEEDISATIGAYFGISKAHAGLSAIDEISGNMVSERAAAWRKIFEDTIDRLEKIETELRQAA